MDPILAFIIAGGILFSFSHGIYDSDRRQRNVQARPQIAQTPVEKTETPGNSRKAPIDSTVRDRNHKRRILKPDQTNPNGEMPTHPKTKQPRQCIQGDDPRYNDCSRVRQAAKNNRHVRSPRLVHVIP